MGLKKTSMRNLVQFKNLSDEEFEQRWQEIQDDKLDKVLGFYDNVEQRMEELHKAFAEDYDLGELRFNDKKVLESLFRAIITLEFYEDSLSALQSKGVSSENLKLVTEINKLISTLRKDITNLQDDLEITKKRRDSEREDSVETYIQNLLNKAQSFYNKKILKAVCPECGMLLFDGWFLFPDSDNKLVLECNRPIEVDEGEKEVRKVCPGRLVISTKELVKLQSSEEYKKKFPSGL